VNRLLLRQLKKCFSVSSETAFFDKLQRLPQTPETLDFTEALSNFLSRVDTSYSNHERDLNLRERSLEISSEELTDAYQQLRQELQLQSTAIDGLTNAANALLHDLGKAPLKENKASLEGLSALMLELAQEKRQAQLELQQQKDALDQHAIVSIADSDGIILYANEKFKRLSGYTDAELLGKTYQIVTNEGLYKDFYNHIWQTISDGRVWNGEIKNQNKNGEIYWVAATIVPIFDETGAFSRFIAISTNITQQKQLEEKISESQQFYQSITDSVGQGIYAVDSCGEVNFLNPEAEKLLGWRFSELSQHHFYTMVKFNKGHTNEADMLTCPVTQHTDKGLTYASEDFYFTNKYGRQFPISIHAVPLLDESGNSIGHVGVFTDISERKRITGELYQAIKASQQANQAKSQFLANISHEIRTPMNAIIGLTHLALETSLTNQQKDYISKAHSSANSLLRTINDVLDFSKIEAGKLELEKGPFECKNFLQRLIDVFSERAQSKNLMLLFDIDVTIPQTLVGDENKLYQVIVNLIGNAIKFTEQGWIVFKINCNQLTSTLRFFEFSVKDSGIGIEKDRTSQLFTPFSQADSSISRQFGGTGLGLSISKSIINKMGGNLTVSSRPGIGSEFKFAIPLKFEQSATPQNEIEKYALSETSATLCVDNPLLLELLDRKLNKLHLHVDINRNILKQSANLPNKVNNHYIIVCTEQSEQLDTSAIEHFIRETQFPVSNIIIATKLNHSYVHQHLFRIGLSQARILTLPFTFETLSRVFATTEIQNNQSQLENEDSFGLDSQYIISNRLNNKRILIVEDEPISQQITHSLLSELGMQTTLANNGQEALDILNAGEVFDCILMDHTMPVLDGLSTTKQIREKFDYVPIIAITANHTEQELRQCIEAGMDSFLVKPISVAELTNSIDNHIQYPKNEAIFKSKLVTDNPLLNLFIQKLTKFNSVSKSIVEFINAPDSLNDAEKFNTLVTMLFTEARSIKANTLAETLDRLCQSTDHYRHVQPDFFKQLNQVYQQTINKISATLNLFANQPNADAMPSQSLPKLTQVINQLEEYDANVIVALDELFEAADLIPWKWQLSEARKSIVNYDYENAIEYLMPIAQKLSKVESDSCNSEH